MSDAPFLTTSDLLAVFDDGDRPAAHQLHRWAKRGILRPTAKYDWSTAGHVWPAWTPRMIRLALRESVNGAHTYRGRNTQSVLFDTADALESHPDALFVTITSDGVIQAHDEAASVVELFEATRCLTVVAVPL